MCSAIGWTQLRSLHQGGGAAAAPPHHQRPDDIPSADIPAYGRVAADDDSALLWRIQLFSGGDIDVIFFPATAIHFSLFKVPASPYLSCCKSRNQVLCTYFPPHFQQRWPQYNRLGNSIHTCTSTKQFTIPDLTDEGQTCAGMPGRQSCAPAQYHRHSHMPSGCPGTRDSDHSPARQQRGSEKTST